MTPSHWIQIASLVVDLLKTIIPFVFIYGIFWLFKKELSTLIKNGGWKVSAPGVSFETFNKQKLKIGSKEKKEIESLNLELYTTKEREKKLRELQENTAKDRETFFIGFHFERTYRLIFPSQMMILNLLRNINSKIREEDFPKRAHQRTIWAQRFNVSYEEFIGFLILAGLIEREDGWIQLSPLGKTYMEYLLNNNIPLKIPPTDIVEGERPEESNV